MHSVDDSWLSGNPYERFMGRWSKLIAQRFLDWFAVPPGGSWLDVGCGPGTLTKLILERQHPKYIVGVDSSSEFIAYVEQSITNPFARFQF